VAGAQVIRAASKQQQILESMQQSSRGSSAAALKRAIANDCAFTGAEQELAAQAKGNLMKIQFAKQTIVFPLLLTAVLASTANASDHGALKETLEGKYQVTKTGIDRGSHYTAGDGVHPSEGWGERRSCVRRDVFEQ
jgi:hypothetical protein